MFVRKKIFLLLQTSDKGKWLETRRDAKPGGLTWAINVQDDAKRIKNCFYYLSARVLLIDSR